MAELFSPIARRGVDDHRSHARHDTRGSALRELRRASRPGAPPRTGADRTALLHERRVAQVRTHGRLKRLAAKPNYRRRSPGRTAVRDVSLVDSRRDSLSVSTTGPAFTSTAL